MSARTEHAVRRQRHDPASRPFLVIWETTRACSLACKHCRAEAAPERDPRELDADEAVALFDQIAAFGAPHPIVVLTGGDPFSRPDLFELIAAASERGLPVALSPSATPSLTADNLRRAHEAGARAVSLSLDGAGPAAHDAFRGVPGAYDWTMSGWVAAQESGLKVQVNTTVTAGTLADLPAIARLVADRGAMTWSAFFLVPVGRGAALDGLRPDQVEDVLHFLYDAGRALPVKTTELHHFRRVVLQRTVLDQLGVDPVPTLGLGSTYQQLSAHFRALGHGGESGPGRSRRPPLDVNAGRGFVFISHVGEVQPSGFLPLIAGNVRDTPLPTIYRDSPLFRVLREPEQLTGACGACEYATVCGGSRSRAFAATGDPMAAEPWCAYEPGTFPYPDEVAALLASPESALSGHAPAVPAGR